MINPVRTITTKTKETLKRELILIKAEIIKIDKIAENNKFID